MPRPLLLLAGLLLLSLLVGPPSRAISKEAAATNAGTDEASTDEASTELPPVGDVLDVGPLAAELARRVEELGTHAADDEAFDEASEMKWNKACGVVACIGQALSQHPEGHKTPGDKLAIRDTALALAEAGDAEEARGLLDPLREALTVPGIEYVDSPDAAEPEGVDWYSMIESYYLMQEINDRNAAIVKVMRRPKGTDEEAANAAVMALLCYPMHAQAEDYVEEEDLPGYYGLTIANMRQAGDIVDAVLAKDRKAVKTTVLAAQQSCKACHQQYRDGE